MSPLRDSEYYRKRAIELRLVADEPRSSGNRETLITFAAYFDQLADEAEGAEEEQLEKTAAC